MNQALTPVPSSASPSVEMAHFSEALLRLYEDARSCAVSEFQDRAMRSVATTLPFDSSWCGRFTFTQGAYQVHSSHLMNLPNDVPNLLNLKDPGNVVAAGITLHPGRALAFGPEDLYAQPGTAELSSHMRAEHVLGMAVIDPLHDVGSFLSVTRGQGQPRFSEQERECLQLWAPHLASALNLCCTTSMARLQRGESSGDCLMATTDELGFIHAAEPDVLTLLQREWPQWCGPRLPADLAASIGSGPGHYSGKSLYAEFRRADPYWLLVLRPRLQQDNLTPQERAVALAYSAGRSYKVVARDLDMAPATVRHHLRAIYAKFEISDKAALVRRLGTRSDVAFAAMR